MYKKLVAQFFIYKILDNANDPAVDVKKFFKIFLKCNFMSCIEDPLILDLVCQIANGKISAEEVVSSEKLKDLTKQLIIKIRRSRGTVTEIYHFIRQLTDDLSFLYDHADLSKDDINQFTDLLTKSETEVVDLIVAAKVRGQNRKMIIYMREEIYHQNMLKKSRV